MKATSPRVLAVILLLILESLAYTLTAQIDLTINGYVTTESLIDAVEKPSSGSKLLVWASDTIYKEIQVSPSGAFYSKLPFGSRYLLQASQPGYAEKFIEFDLTDVNVKKVSKKNSFFELTISMLESRFLIPSIVEDSSYLSVFWDDSKNEVSYSVVNLKSKWAKIDSLRAYYRLALENQPSQNMSENIVDFANQLGWPKSIGDSIKIGVYQDYDLYVNLVNEQLVNPLFAKVELVFLENTDALVRAASNKVNMLYVKQNSGINGAGLLKMVGDNVLLVTNGYGFHETMINFQNVGDETKFEINEIEMSKRGFNVSDQVKLMASITSNKNEWQLAMSSAQASITEERSKVASLTQNQAALKAVNDRLLLAKDSIDNLLSVKSEEVDLLLASIISSKAQLSGLKAMVRDSRDSIMRSRQELQSKQQEFALLEAGFVDKEKEYVLVSSNLDLTSSKIIEAENKLNETNLLLTDLKRTNLWIGVALGCITLSLLLAVYGYFRQRTLTKLVSQKSEVIKNQSKQLLQRNLEVQDSISYAKRIQNAMLPSSTMLKNYFDQAFVMYEPKDVVAGDFFWIREENDCLYFAVADCTGHGVPGAMMSVICHNALNRAIRELGDVEPSKLLDLTRVYVIEQIAQGEESVMDGMDIALCKFDKNSRVLEFAGAQSPLWLLTDRPIDHDQFKQTEIEGSNCSIYEVKGDKQPVGQFSGAKPFINHSIQLTQGDVIYIFSDGFADQFGGKRGKKMKYSLFKQILTLAQDQMILEGQKDFLSEYFVGWKGDLEQVDDVCVMGLKL